MCYILLLVYGGIDSLDAAGLPQSSAGAEHKQEMSVLGCLYPVFPFSFLAAPLYNSSCMRAERHGANQI
jgi:hypothetical protein